MTIGEWCEAMQVKRMCVWRWEHGRATPHPAFVLLAERIATYPLPKVKGRKSK